MSAGPRPILRASRDPSPSGASSAGYRALQGYKFSCSFQQRSLPVESFHLSKSCFELILTGAL